MEKIKRTIDDIFDMSDSRYSLVNAISRKAREIADDAEHNNDVLYQKPVNMVIDRLLDGRATIMHIDDVDEDDIFADDTASDENTAETTDMPDTDDEADTADETDDEE